jgi:hypothetical protein
VRLEAALLAWGELAVEVVRDVALRPAVIARVAHVAYESHHACFDPRVP